MRVSTSASEIKLTRSNFREHWLYIESSDGDQIKVFVSEAELLRLRTQIDDHYPRREPAS